LILFCACGTDRGMDGKISGRRTREEPTYEDMLALWGNTQDLFLALPTPKSSYRWPLAWMLLPNISRDGARALLPNVTEETLRQYVTTKPPSSDLFSRAYKSGVMRSLSPSIEDAAVAYVEERYAAAKSGDKMVGLISRRFLF